MASSDPDPLTSGGDDLIDVSDIFDSKILICEFSFCNEVIITRMRIIPPNIVTAFIFRHVELRTAVLSMALSIIRTR